MGFTNSSLVSYTRISPNRNSPRNQPITKITIHHMAGVMSVEGFGNIVANPAREMSANYAIGNDGRIGLFCEEKDRSWCSSSAWNDNRAITIEVSNSAYGDASGWPISNAAFNSLIKLCVDICKRNGIKKLEFTGDRNGSLTYHYMYWATCCPGPWIKAHTQEICSRVNAQLNASSSTTDTGFKSYTVKLKSTDPVYDTPGGKQTTTVGAGNVFTIVDEKVVNKVKYGKLKSGKGWVILEKPEPDNSYTVTLKGSAAVYESAGGKQNGTVGKDGVYTITENKKVGYITYGKLKSGKGWVIVKNETPTPSFKTGDLVSVASNAVYYNGGGIPTWVKNKKWYISSISGSRAILGKSEDGSFNIQSAINTKYLTKASATPSLDIKKGDRVKVVNNIIYGTNNRFTVYASFYYVLEVSGDRLVISSDGRNVTTAIAKKNVQKI